MCLADSKLLLGQLGFHLFNGGICCLDTCHQKGFRMARWPSCPLRLQTLLKFCSIFLSFFLCRPLQSKAAYVIKEWSKWADHVRSCSFHCLSSEAWCPAEASCNKAVVWQRAPLSNWLCCKKRLPSTSPPICNLSFDCSKGFVVGGPVWGRDSSPWEVACSLILWKITLIGGPAEIRSCFTRNKKNLGFQQVIGRDDLQMPWRALTAVQNFHIFWHDIRDTSYSRSVIYGGVDLLIETSSGLCTVRLDCRIIPHRSPHMHWQCMRSHRDVRLLMNAHTYALRNVCL